MSLAKKKSAASAAAKVAILQTTGEIKVSTDRIQCFIPKSRNQLIRLLKIDDKDVSTGGKLVCILQDGPNTESGVQPAKEAFLGNVEKVTVEQDGPVRAVVKVEGKHVAENGGRSWLPYVVRLYFYAGQQTIRWENELPNSIHLMRRSRS